MTDAEKISQLLGSDMAVIDRKTLSQCELASSTEDWLATIGIPKTVQLPFNLILKGAYDLRHVPNKPESGYIIGETEGPCYIVVRYDGVVAILDDTDYPERFVNSSISQFIMSLCVFAERLQSEMDVKEYENRLTQIDPEAIRNKNGFWAIDIEEAINFGVDP